MRSSRRGPLAAAPALLLALGAFAPSVAQEPPERPSAPLPSGLVETVETRLVQLDVSVEGKDDTIYELTSSDFELLVAGREITTFNLDRLCEKRGPERTEAEKASEGAPRPPAAPPVPRATYVFFFDQPHLTFTGRARAMDVARQLVRRLVGGGSRAMVVSNAREVVTVVPLTGDAMELLRGLDGLEKDFRQWDPYAEGEPQRSLDVLRAGDPGTACSRARAFAREEWWQARRSLHRFATVLGTLVDIQPPKVAFYFADTLRQKSGLHYLYLRRDEQEIPRGEMIPEAAFEFDHLLKVANTFGGSVKRCVNELRRRPSPIAPRT